MARAGEPTISDLSGNDLALGDERAGADQAAGADARAVEHDRAHADERVLPRSCSRAG